ncbi:MAG: prepilin-type N-terminal cleavage/methylation domain-containing protein [bacterium]|nr:prepilin-type N-terminal cleavage/methylation domain-containing protein [bacterium]
MNQSGYSLPEVLVALFILSLAILGVAPMFVLAITNTSVGADASAANAVAVEYMETLRAVDFETLVDGGSLDSDATGYSETAGDFDVRWTVEDNVTPSGTKLITVLARSNTGSRRTATLSLVRGR